MLKLMLDAITARYTSSGASSGVATSSTWIDLRGSLSARVDALEHPDVVAADERRPVRLGDREVGDVVAARSGLDGVEDLLHDARLPTGNLAAQSAATVAPVPTFDHFARSAPRVRCAHGSLRIPYIVAGARTPIGKMRARSPRSPPPTSAASRSRPRSSAPASPPTRSQHVIMGQVLMAGQGQVPSRQAAVKAGIPMNVPSVNVNKVCLSGLNTIYLAEPDDRRRRGRHRRRRRDGVDDQRAVLADGARGGFRYGNTELADAIISDGLWCAFDACLMGLGTDRYTGDTHHPRRAGRVSRDSPTSGPPRRSRTVGSPTRSCRSSPQRGATRSSSSTTRASARHDAESLGKLRPAFDPDGTITAGNASQLSDGGSASC